MNKKGFVTNFVFGLIGLFILLLIVVILMPVKHGDMELEKAMSSLETTQQNLTTKFQVNESDVPIKKILYKFIDFMVYSSFEVAKLGARVGNETFGANGVMWLLYLIILSLLIPTLVGLVKIFVIIGILIYDLGKYLKEKKELKELRRRD